MKLLNLLVDFQPSFIEQCLVDVTVQEGKGEIEIILKPLDTPLSKHIISKKVSLDKERFESFLNAINLETLFRFQTKESVGLDGVTVSVHVKEDQRMNSFEFWSPRKAENPTEHQLVESLFRLIRQHFQEDGFENYLELLERYFEFGLPVKIKSTDPFVVRIYGGLSSGMEEELTQFFEGLPVDKPILIDMSNFERMGTIYYPVFRKFLLRHNRLLWVADNYVEDQLLAIGIQPQAIFKDLPTDMKEIKR